MNQHTRLKPLFHPGKLLVSPAALAALRANGIPVISVVLRHICGDWGSVSQSDREQNDLSIPTGLRLLSLYHLPDGSRIFVTTAWDRSHTTIEKLDGGPADREARPESMPGRRRPVWPAFSCLPGACA